MSYEDSFDDFLGFLRPRLEEGYRILAPNGSFYLHLGLKEVHYAKITMDQIFGRKCYNGSVAIAWDYGSKSKRKWANKHDEILYYVKDPKNYTFNVDDIDRIPYMAPEMVTPEKAAKGKLPTDCYDDQTDILTQSGWSPFWALGNDETVATVSPEGKISYVPSRKLHRYTYEGDMIQIQAQGVNLCVTPNHRLYVRRAEDSQYQFIEAEKFANENSDGDVFFVYSYKPETGTLQEVSITHANVSRVPYSRKVFCCTVEPYHTLIVRREGLACVCGNCWWIGIIGTASRERTGYPTQKALRMMDRIIRASSNPGDLVMDFFAGSGTTGESAARLGRRFLLMDKNPAAHEVMQKRLAQYDTHFYTINGDFSNPIFENE